MSGTSFDGVDAALLCTDGESEIELGAALSFPYELALRDQINGILGHSTAPLSIIKSVTNAHIEAAIELLASTKLKARDVQAIGLHGQTILHDPENKTSVQIGNGQELANQMQIDVVEQFRTSDIQAGGQGAPIAPVYHRALMQAGPLPAVFVNIGGVSNVTWSDGSKMIGFDVGPGNARLDDWMRSRSGLPYDDRGEHGLRGSVHASIVEAALANAFFNSRPPKSLDRDELLVPGIETLSVEDGAATLASITANAIIASEQFMPSAPKRWIICGGGRLNMAIMKRLRNSFGSKLFSAEEAGLNGDAVEAHLMAFLAARYMKGLPITYPETTGVSEPMVGGILRQPEGIPSAAR